MPVADMNIDHLFVVDPGLDSVADKAQAEPVPAPRLKDAVSGGFVLARVHAVEAGEPNHRAAPTAIDPGTI